MGLPKKEGPQPRLYTLHSQKGGVGKTSVAIAIACLESAGLSDKNKPASPKRVLVLDADLTGTCIEDALALDMTTNLNRGPWLDDVLLAAPDDFLAIAHPTRRGSLSAKGESWWNDLTRRYGAKERDACSFDYIPSNPDLHAVRTIVPSLAQECHLHYYASRLESLVLAAWRKGYLTVIIDLPPGLFGLSIAAFQVATDGLLEEGRSKEEKQLGCPIFVTTTDEADYRATVPTIWQLLDEELERRKRAEQSGHLKRTPDVSDPLWQLWFNKASREDDSVLQVGRCLDDLRKCLGSSSMKQRARSECEQKKWLERLDHYRKTVSIRGAQVMPQITNFRVADIAATVERISSNGAPKDWLPDSMERWVKTISAMVCDLWD